MTPRSRVQTTLRLFQFGLVGGKFRLAHRSVVVGVKLLPHSLHLGVGRCFGRAQLAVVIGVEPRKRAGSRTLAVLVVAVLLSFVFVLPLVADWAVTLLVSPAAAATPVATASAGTNSPTSNLVLNAFIVSLQ